MGYIVAKQRFLKDIEIEVLFPTENGEYSTGTFRADLVLLDTDALEGKTPLEQLELSVKAVRGIGSETESLEPDEQRKLAINDRYAAAALEFRLREYRDPNFRKIIERAAQRFANESQTVRTALGDTDEGAGEPTLN